MKKLLFMLLASFLLLSACGNEEESNLDDKKETKSEDKDKESDKEQETDKKEDKSDSKDEKSNEEVANNKNKQNKTSQEKQKMENQNNTQQQDSNINNNEGTTQQGNRPFGGIPPKGMTNEEYQVLENNMPNANNVSSEEYEKLLNEQVQRIANKNNHSIETPMGTFTPNNHNENTDQNQK
ncbi:hypothetical protein EWS82_06295 [Staphylococcus xylosus]|nr:hypothetical protein [Staphylococcus xylosus]